MLPPEGATECCIEGQACPKVETPLCVERLDHDALKQIDYDLLTAEVEELSTAWTDAQDYSDWQQTCQYHYSTDCETLTPEQKAGASRIYCVGKLNKKECEVPVK